MRSSSVSAVPNNPSFSDKEAAAGGAWGTGTAVDSTLSETGGGALPTGWLASMPAAFSTAAPTTEVMSW